MRGHPGPKLTVSAKAWLGPVTSVLGIRSVTFITFSPMNKVAVVSSGEASTGV